MTELIVMGRGVELGTFAMLMEPLGKPEGEEYGPVIPGPEMKNPNTSLYSELIQVKYSLDPKT